MGQESVELPAQIAPDELDLPAPLREYQWEGVSFLARSEAALLADEMGLGKTVQAAVALRLVLRLEGCDRALVVAPASIRLNWERELARWAPELPVRRVQGSAEDRAATYRLPIPVLVVSYEQIRADARELDPSLTFDVVLLDEAQRIKNPDSDTALACRLIPRKSAWAMTGTPMENQPDDLISIFRFVKPGSVYRGLSREAIHDRMKPYFLRRRKHEVLEELPPLIVQDLPLELQGLQKAAYEEMWDSRGALVQAHGVPVAATDLLALITKLKQLCNFDRVSEESIKLDALRLVLESFTESSDKVIVFSQYVETLRWLAERIDRFPHDLFHGSLSETQRDEVLARFEHEPGPRALLMSLRAGGVGLNLQAASTVVLFDRWWNPAVEDQAIQRAHRFGRDRPLHVMRFLVMNSIEDRIAELLEEKRELFANYVDAAESAVVRMFSRDELRRVLGLSQLTVEGQVGQTEASQA